MSEVANPRLHKALRERGLYYNQVSIMYIPAEEDEAAQLVQSIKKDQIPSIDDWKKYDNKMKDIYDESYKNQLLEKLKYQTSQIAKDAELHKFMLENFNAESEYVYYDIKIKRDLIWDGVMSHADKLQSIKGLIDMDKKYPLEPGYYIKVFDGFELDELSEYPDNIVIKQRIKTDKIPFLLSAMYNPLIFTAHEYNVYSRYKKEKPYVVTSVDIPYYAAIKPVKKVYTRKAYEEYIKSQVQKKVS
jgi:hypothetical protein